MKTKAPVNIAGIFYFFACTCILPFIVDNKYFNMLETKAAGYLFIAGGTAVLLGLSAMYCKFKDKPVSYFEKFKFNMLDICVLAFGVLALLSCLLSDNVKAALTGSDGWGMGGFIILAFVAGYLLLSRSKIDLKKLWFFAAVANIIVFVIGIFHSASVDLFELHEGILQSQYFWYISTIGNINWLVGYLCLLLPVFFVFFLNSKTAGEYIVYGAVSLLGILNTVLSASDGIYLGMGFFALFFAVYIMRDNNRISKTSALVCFFGLSLMAVNYLPCFAAKKADLDGLSDFVVTSGIGLYIALFGAVCGVLSLVFKDKIGKKFRTAVLIIFELVLIGTIAAVFVYSVKSFDNQWGHSRGAIWITSLEIYRGFGFVRKLFGCGIDMLGNYLKSLDETFARPVLNAHNEYIQYLLTMGSAGFASYIGMYIFSAIEFFKSKKNSHEIYAYMLAVVAYFAQAAVNNPQAVNYALLFTILALLRNEMGKNCKNGK